jgi:nucleoside-diphosphate-sugar epimerase
VKVLVTGSSGFIGQHLSLALVDRGDDVLGVDRREPAGGTRHPFECCDLLEGETLSTVVAAFAPDAICHLAARADLDERVGLPGYAANIEGVENLIRAIRATPSVRRALFTSTQLVCPLGHTPRSDEDYGPTTTYGASKVRGEQIVRREDGGGVTWCITRPTTVWGPGMSAHYQRFLGMIRRGVYVHVGRRPRLKSFGYVGNVVHQYIRLLEVPAERIHRRTLYVGDYEPLALQRWADELAKAFRARRIPTIPEAVARAAAGVGDAANAFGWRRFPFNSVRLNNVLTEYIFDLTATRDICGDNPHSLEAGVAATAAWFVGLR